MSRIPAPCPLVCSLFTTVRSSQFGVLVGLGTALQQESARMVHKVNKVLAGNRACGVVFSHDHDLVPVAVVLASHQCAAHGQLVTQHLQQKGPLHEATP